MLLLAGWNNLNQHATDVIPIQRHDFNDCNHLTSEDSEPPELEHVLDDKEYCPQQSSSSLMQGSHLSSTSELSAQQSDDWYVFDPVFGVIPRETRDLWRQQQQQAVEVSSMDRSRGMMRSTSGDGDGDGGMVRTRSVNRPVRYSNEQRMTEDGCSTGSSSEVEKVQGSTVKLAVDGKSIS